MKKELKIVLLLILLVSCTHIKSIEGIPAPLSLREQDVSGINSIRLKVRDSTPKNGELKISLEILDQRFVEAFTRRGILLSSSSPNNLELAINRFMIIGDGLFFCQSIIDITATSTIKGRRPKSMRFTASMNGYFCIFGNSSEKMKKPTKEALEQVLNSILKWLVNSENVH
jgi:uncharacterized lipoprotein YajG